MSDRFLEPFQASPDRLHAHEVNGRPTTNLTALQAEFWIGQKLYPEMPFFHCTDTFTIRGTIDPSHFSAAFQRLIEGTDALRTVFAERDGTPRQIVLDELRYRVEYFDLSEARTARAQFGDWLQQRSQSAIKLEKRAFDTALVKISRDEFIWYLKVHHIVADGRTLHLLFQRVQELYGRSLEGSLNGPVSFPRFQDYIEAEHAYRSSPECVSDREFWKKKLTGTHPLTFYGRHAAAGPALVHRINRGLGAERTARLECLSRQERFTGKTPNVSLFNMLAGVLAAYLHKISGNEQFYVATPFSNRSTLALQQTAGLLMQIAPLRVMIAKEDTFASIIRKLQVESAETARHCRYPTVHQKNTLYDVLFNFTSGFPNSFCGMPAGENIICSGNDRYSFSLHVRYPKSGSMLLQFDFHPDVFDGKQQNRAVEHFLRTLDAFLQDPDARIDRFELISPAERRCVLTDFNPARVAHRQEQNACIHQLFEEQAEKTPDAVAVVCQDRHLTYRALNERANQIARYLTNLGVGPESRVGLCHERSLDVVVGLLGILKTGGAYVPLDPAYPRERLAFMANDAQAGVVLTQQRLLNRLPESLKQVVCLDTDWPKIARHSRSDQKTMVKPHNLAYVIYTSGSTGLPKGVAIEHRNAVALLAWAHTVFTREEMAGVLASTSICFDLSVFELFAPLTCGGQVLLAENALSLAEMRDASRVTLINAVPSAIAELLHLDAIPSSVRTICLAGERLKSSLAAALYEKTKASRVYDLYGPSEDTTYSTFALRSQTGPETIGRPITNTQVYILDGQMQPVPIGIAGEICIGGDGLARGYLRRPELTAEKFIANPFSDKPGARLYKTGDLARYRRDGNIEFLGRIDHQVKIRGYRIELEEIELVLARHPAVRQAVVVVHDEGKNEPGDSSDRKRLVGYVAVEPAVAVTIPGLRAFVREKLPEYMVPSSFVLLESLPLTPNGKVDRKALPQPDGCDLSVGPVVPPRTPAEETVARIWAEVLNLATIGIHEDFFDIGGHSLLATQIMSRVNHAFQTDLPLRTIFEAPTVAGMAERIHNSRTSLVKDDELPSLPNVSAASDQDHPLSFAQQRLWFLDQMEPNSSVYNVPIAYRLKGPLVVDALERSLNEIVRRHELLRTTFSFSGGRPVQRIAPTLTIALPVTDLSGLSEADAEAEVERLARQEAGRGFDLERGPVVRGALVRVGLDHHIFLLTIHHIACDGWSLGVLFRELTILYEAFCKGEPSPLEQPPIQYSDFARWQRDWLEGEVLHCQLNYWRKQLENVKTLQLPTDRPRPAMQSYRGASQSIVLSSELSGQLKALSRQQGVTLFMTLLAGFQTLLHRYTGQDDIAVGSPIANRTRVEIEGLIGFFVNTLVLRTDLSGRPKFTDLLARVREISLEAYAHQDLPFERLVEEIKPERNLGNSPLFQVMFVFQNAPTSPLFLKALTANPLTVSGETAKFDMLLTMSDAPEGLAAAVQYNTDLFDASTIGRMLSHLETLLKGIVADPACRISDLPLMAPAERHQVLREWNDTRSDVPQAISVHELFQAQAAKTPDRIAVTFGGEQLSYRVLNRRANQLASLLQKRGVGPGSTVGIYTNRSMETIIGLLAILKAGGTYVPLDPAYPTERLSFMLKDARISTLIAHTRLLQGLPRHGTAVLCLEEVCEEMRRENGENLENRTTGEDLVYLIYTSGSTGAPKAVAMRHHSLCNLITWQITNFKWCQPARTLQFASLGFDVSFQEIFSTLCSGGTLVLISEELRSDATSLARFLQDELVERVFLPYVALQQLADAVVRQGGVPQSLREIITAGEPLQITAEIAKLFAMLRNCTLENQYGPSETHVVTRYRVRDHASGWPPLPPIGRPIANVRIHILDPNLNPVPIGIPGELHIGGVGLARGYFNRGDLTAEKFIPDPFDDGAGARLYKTGDRARYLPDGNIEFLGRVDDQVKVRGFRVEPKEIETVLGQHPAVREAVVAAEGMGADRRLIAYVVAAPTAALSARYVKAFLKQKLPEYMVPSSVVFLNALPLTVNGKVDRRSLPGPTASSAQSDANFSAARTATEEIVMAIWADLLKLERIDIHDNFFDLGGHSLLATRVVSRVRELFKIDLSLRSFVDDPTIARLAERIEKCRTEQLGAPDLSILPFPRGGELPLSYAQERLWFLDQLEPGSAAYNLSSAWRIRGSLDMAALERSLHELLRRHEALRTTFPSFDGRPIQMVAAEVTLSFSVIDLGHLGQAAREEEARRLAGEEAHRPFDLAHGPLFRASLIRFGKEDHDLLLTMHHIVSDGWSMGVLYRELALLYQAFSGRDSSPLADLPLQYADFAVWQRAWLQGETLEAQLSYWKAELTGAPPVLNLPTDSPRSTSRNSQAIPLPLTLSRELSQRLRQLSGREGATLFMTLLAAFQTLLHRHTGQEDIVVGAPIANRNRIEIEGLIGFFVNTLPLRSKLSGGLTFRELLAQVKECAFGAYAHQDLPFEKLVEEMHPERSLTHTPLVQILFNMLNQENSNLDLPGLTIERVSPSSVESKFDLTLYVRQQDDDLGLTLVYRSDLFSEGRMQSLLEQYRHLLEQIVAAPDKPIGAYSLVTPESRPLLPDPCGVLAEPPQETVTEAFFSQMILRPADPAICQGGQTWSYRELGSRAEALARRIGESGVLPGDVVAISGEPSFGLIAAMLAVFMAGGVLLPVDPALPMERRRRMLQEAKAKKLLYSGAMPNEGSWPEQHFASGIEFIDPATACDLETAKDRGGGVTGLARVEPDSPAYIFFTSGSTGVPKGVLGCHKGLSHFLRWQRETFAIGPGDRVAQLTALSFDAVLRDVFLPLTSGALLCLPESSDTNEPKALLDWLERERITVLHVVPSVARSWLTEPIVSADLANLRWAFFMGEPLHDAFVRQWQAAFHSRAEVVNLYGPTETTLIKCFYRVPAVMQAGVQPVGGPIADTQVLVVNKSGTLCGVYEPGEIVLRTPFRSLGYVNSAEETAKRFVKNPFRDDEKDLVYFTGDAGCYHPDGTVAILGRQDDQIKVRGVRVEPAEVAAVLARHPSVQNCAVLGKKDERGESHLIAYVVASAVATVTIAQLRSYLLEQLPAAMVPSYFVLLPVLPLTANGKIDRKALPEPDSQASKQQERYSPPRTRTETLIAGVWGEILTINPVGIFDNFFDLGGHSLLATRIVSRLRKVLQVDLSLRALFENPTVATLADHIQAIKRPVKQQSAVTDTGDETEELIL